ncbi:nonribosomal peptide [Colletotrichum karsti]|uniref:Nonribosomal peptide n=1 Tax=Colletotrichum karsti TaxID=1095194 RepID=A0A9P6HYR9_9PEZI|nr:nonribosomal peptide [Colletotrichum karsti]KAF9873034.1 nonribosomal peptide [Colletotrichum karsti]
MFTETATASVAVEDADAVVSFCSSHRLSREAFYVAAWTYTLSIYSASSAVRTNLVQESQEDACLTISPVSATIEGHMNIVEACLAPNTSERCSGIDRERSHRQSAAESSIHDGGSVMGFVHDNNTQLFDDLRRSFKVSLVINHRNDVTLQYLQQSLPALSAEAFLETFTTIVNRFATSRPDTILNDLDVLGPVNRATLESWSPRCLPAVERCIHEYVDEHAKLNPFKEAVVGTEGLNFTYAQLSSLSNRLAAYLIKLGIKKGEVIPILFDKSPVAVLAIIAIMKAGAAYVGFSAETPVNFLRECSSIADVPLIITSPQHAKLAERIGRRALILDQAFLTTLSSASTVELFRSPAQPSDLAYLVFTSGSTGVPKAVMIEHRAYITDALAQQKAALLDADSRVLHFASYNFDATNFDILSTLIAGGTICVPTEFDRINRLAGAIDDLRANFIGVTATLAQTLEPDDVPSLRVVILCGEANNTELVQKWSKSGSHARDVVNGYGPSEASCAFSYNVYTRQSPRANNVGRALEGACWGWVVNPDNYNQLLPVGAIGELLIQGPTLSRGYLREPEKTAKAFIEGPSWLPKETAEELRRLYRTGDLVRQLPDQSFEVFGRVDTQVKLNGQRVELGEIENKISRVLGDKYIIAVEAVRPSPQEQSKMLIAYYAPKLGSHQKDIPVLDIINTSEGAVVDVQNTQRRLSDDLKAVAIPKAFIPLRFMPVTTQGKLDRKFLQALGSHLDDESLGAFSGRAEPVRGDVITTYTEKTVQQLFAKTLNLSTESIFRDSDFFALGGDSVKAIKLVALARKLGISLSVPNILLNPKVSSLACLLGQQENTPETTIEYHPFDSIVDETLRDEVMERAADLIPVDDEVEDVIEATDLQASCVAFSTYKEERRGINWLLCDFVKPQDEKTVRQMCKWLTSRHGTLRTSFMAFRRTLYQVVSKSFQPPIKTRLHLMDIQDATMYIMEDDLLDRDVDMAQPQTAFELLSHGDSSSIERLVIRLSAAQYDGQSVAILRREMSSFLGNTQDDNPSGHLIAQIKGSYPGYLHHARQVEFDHGIEYWRNLLADAKMTQITSCTSRPGNSPSGLNFVDGVLVKMVKTQLLDLTTTQPMIATKVRSSRSTRATIVKTAWALTLAELTGETDVVFGSTGWGRNSPVDFAQDVMGSCTSHIPTRAQLNRSAGDQNSRITYGELVEELQAQHVASMRFENIGANTIVEKCTSWPRWTRFSSLLVFQGLDIEPSHRNVGNGNNSQKPAASVRFTEIMDPGDRADIIVHVEPFGEETRVMMAFAKKNIPERVAGKVLETFERCLEHISLRTNEAIDLGDSRLSPLLPVDCNKVKMDEDDSEEDHGGEGTWEQAEAYVKETWSDLLALKSAEFDGLREREESFLSVWGNPVSAAALAHGYRKDGLALSTEDMLRHQTVRSQVRLISSLLRT